MKHVFIFLLMICTLIKGQTAEPAWIKYPPPGTYVGISKLYETEQEARLDAEKDAKRQIINSLGGIIEAEFVDQIIEEKNSQKSYTDSKVKIIARNILNVTTADFYIKRIEKKTGFLKKQQFYQAYAAVEFSRHEHNKFIDELIQETENSYQARLSELIEKTESGQALFALLEMKKLPAEFISLMAITGLTPAQTGRLKTINQELNSEISEIQNNIHLSAKQQKFFTKLNQPLPEEIQIFLYLDKAGRKIPVQGAEVTFDLISGDADFNYQSTTDHQGLSSCHINEIISTEKIIMRATVKFSQELMMDSLTYDFHLLPDNKIAIQITEKNDGTLNNDSYLTQLLIQRFTEAGFQVTESQLLKEMDFGKAGIMDKTAMASTMENERDFLIFGQVTVDRTNKVSDGLHFAWAVATVKLYDVTKEEILESVILEKKSAGNSNYDAGVKAIAAVSDIAVEKITDKILNRGKSK
jgi:hypothetical protein